MVRARRENYHVQLFECITFYAKNRPKTMIIAIVLLVYILWRWKIATLFIFANFILCLQRGLVGTRVYSVYSQLEILVYISHLYMHKASEVDAVQHVWFDGRLMIFRSKVYSLYQATYKTCWQQKCDEVVSFNTVFIIGSFDAIVILGMACNSSYDSIRHFEQLSV